MRFTPEQHLEMARRLQARCETELDPKKAEKQARMANVFRRLAERAGKRSVADIAPTQDVSIQQNDKVAAHANEGSRLTDRRGGRDYFADYNLAVQAYERELNRAFGFAFLPELDQQGAEAPPGSELRRTYDAMVEARRARDERHPPGTWMG
ncbi:hypothetical protein [Bradyrhizobium sp. BRP23]|uniref:hypothetical protein n=1 Tax=Bradyrhizobium sp. BRP23 TaxID=2793820 RepID=UPI001CD536C5|nr:hypothetical protein [Bradyrhizobium sp. BRP23]MCA1381466.1 hypothetical protein [Bradyrhizobium sp. BRP05]MCA1422278.1 hypothetical protein [Bradyrhizobium sp. BRP23]